MIAQSSNLTLISNCAPDDVWAWAQNWVSSRDKQ